LEKSIPVSQGVEFLVYNLHRKSNALKKSPYSVATHLMSAKRERTMGDSQVTITDIKTDIPALPTGTVFRNHLFIKVDDFIHFSLNLLTAPPGFGKSTLLASWAHRCGHPVAWLSLSREEASIGRFFSFLSYSLSRATNKEVRVPYELHETRDRADTASNAGRLIGYIDGLIHALGSYSKQLFCILDDFQNLDGSKDLFESLNYLIDNSPSNFHLIIASRSLPALHISKRRADNKLREISEDDLLFSSSELQRCLVLNRINIPTWYFTRIQKMTFGLPVAISFVMKLLENNRIEDSLEQIDAQFGDQLRQYFLEEYLEPLPENIKRMISVTYFLPEFSASLAQWQLSTEGIPVDDSLVCNDLHFMKNRGLLLAREDDEGEIWYRHLPPLVNALVFSQVIHRGSHERRLHQQASEWYIGEGMLDKAVQIASNAQNYDTIRDLILKNWRKMQESDELSVLLDWFSRLPEDYIVRYPKLCLFEVLPLGAAGDFRLAHKRFDRARKLSKTDDDLYSSTANALYSLVLSMEGKYSKSQELAKKAIKTLPDEEEHLKSMVYQTLGAASFPHDIVKAYQLLQKAEVIQASVSDRNVRCSLFANLARVEALLGLDSRATRHIAFARETFPQQLENVVPMLTFAQVAEGIVHYQRGDLPTARCLLEKTIENSRFIYLPRNIASAKALLAAILVNTGRSDEASELTRQACELDPGGIVDIFPGLGPLSVWLRHDNAGGLTIQSLCGSTSTRGIAQRWLALAVVFIEGGEPHQTELDKLEHSIDSSRYPLAFINVLILKAAIHERAGSTDDSIQLLARALSRAHEEQITQPFADAYRYIKKSLRSLAKAQPESFASAIFRQLSKHSDIRPESSSQQKLTTRELDVMRLIDAGLSTQDIAERLFISAETVKKHLVHVYTKLEVHSRYEALSTIRIQGLL
jgi:LuxR family maltose regulon positive regulatory protein